MKVFIVLHHEIMGTPENHRCDEMVFYTASSIKTALALIKSSGVCRWSWWEIQRQELNGSDWPEHVGYYGLRGGKLAKAPYDKCVAIFKKEYGAQAGDDP
ncbi:MAG TPA: hypothetical protein VG125_25255 [Pirellulales bacterium]|jgi:hypothetical protein|nr:hypothetical protein [Pirellulales bacterium]